MNKTGKQILHAGLYLVVFILIQFFVQIVVVGGYMLFKLGYMFEVNINPGVRRDIYSPNERTKGWYDKSIADIGEAKIREEAARQLAEWRKGAIGRQFNHYIRLSAEVAY